jgi:hypothetical protein
MFRWLCVFLVAAATLAVVGCDEGKPAAKSGASGSGSDGAGSNADAVAMAKEVDKYAAEQLATSKIDAKQWLAGPKHVTFEATKADIVKLTDDLLAAGATGVWVSDPEETEGTQVIDGIFVELPSDAAKRTKIFQVANKANDAFSMDRDRDVGQKYLDFSWD